MNRSLPIKIYAAILLVIFGGIVLHAPFSVGFGVLFPSIELLIKSWKEILMIPAVLLAAWLVWHSKKRTEFAGDRILQVAMLYILLHLLVAVALLQGPLATLAGLAIDLRHVVFFMLVYTLLKLAPEYKKPFLAAGAIGAVIVVGFGVMQLFLPADVLSHIGYGKDTIQPYLTVDKNPDYVRINSTLRGPNPLGAYVMIIISLLVAAVVKGRINVRRAKGAWLAGVALLSGLAVLWASYSRSAAAATALAILLVILLAARRLISRRVWIAGCIVVCALVGGVIMGRDHSFITNVVLHENREGGSAVSSNDAHLESFIDGTERMLRQPIGAGIGSTGSASLMTDEPLIIENQYLFIAHEVGWFGLGLFGALLYLVFEKLWKYRKDWLSLGVFASGIGILAVALIQPVWVDDTVSIIWWGLAAIAIALGGQNVGRTTKQKAKRSI